MSEDLIFAHLLTNAGYANICLSITFVLLDGEQTDRNNTIANGIIKLNLYRKSSGTKSTFNRRAGILVEGALNGK